MHTPPLRGEDEALTKCAGPGNIRGPENKVHRAVIMTSGRVIEPADLELNGSGSVGAQSTQGSSRQEDQRLVDELKRAAKVAD